MIRATFTAAVLGVFALRAGAQIPTPPTPAPSPVPPIISQPATPRTPPARVIAPRRRDWQLLDLSDLDDRLDAIRDMKMDLRLPPMPDLEPMHDMDMDLSSMDEAMGRMDEVMSRLDFDLDFDIPPVPPMPPIPPIPPLPPLPPIPPIPPLPPIPPIEPMIMDAIEMGPMVSVAPAARAISNSRLTSSIARVAGLSPFERQFGGIAYDPPKAWAQSDPADSLYRLAREALNHGEYRRAAQLFGDITQRFPSSVYAADARYWRAFALYRIGGTSELRDALASLTQDNSRVYRSASLQADAPTLAARIRGALAAQGDADAKRQLGAAASQPGGACDREDVAVRVQALNSLGQTDPEATIPILRRVLARRDECSASLRRAALWLLGRRTDADAMALVMNTARTDPDLRVRSDALRFLAAMPGDQAISVIEEIARTPGNEEIQRAAVSALGRSDAPRARQSIRNIIERPELSETLRATALSSVDAEHISDNGAYIRSIYPRLETPRLKASAIRAVARIGGTDNEQWLLSVVRNGTESVDVRAMALSYAGRSSIPITDLLRMYDVAGDRPLREQLVRLYAQRPDAQATDKLIEIARTGTDPEMRRLAISALSRKNDPRTKQLLLEIIDK